MWLVWGAEIKGIFLDIGILLLRLFVLHVVHVGLDMQTGWWWWYVLGKVNLAWEVVNTDHFLYLGGSQLAQP